MMEDFIKDLKFHVYERLRSPLITSFCVSWVSWNFSTVLLLFGKGDFDKKIGVLGKIYETNFSYFLNGLIYPLISACIFIFIYPYLARYAFIYWSSQLVETKKKQLEVEDQTPMTLEDAKEFKKKFYTTYKDTENEVERLQASNQLLKAAEKNHEAQNDLYKKQILDKENEASSLKLEIASLRANLEDKDKTITNLQSNFNKVAEQKISQKEENLSIESFAKLLKIDNIDDEKLAHDLELLKDFTLKEKLDLDELKLLLLLTFYNGQTKVESIRSYLKLNGIHFASFLNDLSKRGYISLVNGNQEVRLDAEATNKLYKAKITNIGSLKRLIELLSQD